MYREWADPRDGTVWLVQIFFGTSEDPFGRPRAIPRMITFRLPVDIDRPAREVYSAPLVGVGPLDELTDEELVSHLRAARDLGPRDDSPGAAARG